MAEGEEGGVGRGRGHRRGQALVLMAHHRQRDIQSSLRALTRWSSGARVGLERAGSLVRGPLETYCLAFHRNNSECCS